MAEKYPSLLVAADDFAAVTALSLPVSLIVASGNRENLAFSLEGAELPPEQLVLFVVGRLAASDTGRAQQAEIAEYWQNRFGTAAPEEIDADLSDADAARTSISERVIGLMAGDRQTMARRSTGFMRELAVLRQQHEDLQSGFRELERFVRSNRLVTSTPATTLSPVTREMPITLGDGAQLSLLLPGGSAGLCDLALHFCHEAPAHGVFHMSLYGPAINQTLAVWEVPAHTLHGGWQRFTIDRAMGADMIDLTLHVSYQGPGEVKLSSSLHHPDTRFRARLGEQVLPALPAFRLWRWIAGGITPATAGAFIQNGGQNRMRRVSMDTMRTTINLDTLINDLPIFETERAIQLHVVPDKIACGIMPGIALPGTRRIQADLQTRHPDGPPVEYRLGLLPETKRPVKQGVLPDFDPAHTSDWVRLERLEEGQAHLILPEPLSHRYDLYLMTRLPDGHRNNAFGWATFSEIRQYL